MASGNDYQRGTTASPQAARRVIANLAPQVQALPDTSSTFATASLTTAIAGNNNDVTYTAKASGTAANSITVRYVVSGTNTPLSVSVAGSAITVNVATDGAGAATSTAAAVRDAVNNNASASALVHADLAAGNDGTGVVAALAATPLAGGQDVKPGKPGNAPLPRIPPIHYSYGR